MSGVFCKQVKESVRVPVVANGDIRCEDDIHRVAEMTGVDGQTNSHSGCLMLQGVGYHN